jgi:hypothetical protein
MYLSLQGTMNTFSFLEAVSYLQTMLPTMDRAFHAAQGMQITFILQASFYSLASLMRLSMLSVTHTSASRLHSTSISDFRATQKSQTACKTANTPEENE